ncbi:MAG: ABC transporter permease [Ignavibacteriaceae bacterium]
MKKIFAVAKWEYLEKVKTKTFIISLILTPAIIIGFALAPTFLSGRSETSTKAIGIIDTSGLFINGIKDGLEKFKLKNNQPTYLLINLTSRSQDQNELKSSADAAVISGQLDGYLLINSGGTDSVSVEYLSKNTGNYKDINNFENAFNKVRLEIKLTEENINPKIAEYLSEKTEIKPIKINGNGKESKPDFLTVFFTSFIFIILLMMMILSSGGMLIRNLVEEKSNRLIEILVSSCSPNQLLTGKVLGLSSLGLTQVIIWGLIGMALAGTSTIPNDAFNNIFPMFIYFVLGFIFYTAIFVGIGSIVTTEQEAQQITSYLSLTLVLPIAISVPAIENPDSVFVHVLSYIPFTIPSIMILRFNIESIPFSEILTTFLIMAISIYLAIIGSSKIFRIGILSYGKRPSLKELINWLKEK